MCVRRDEAEAEQEGRIAFADAAARWVLLRERAGSVARERKEQTVQMTRLEGRWNIFSAQITEDMSRCSERWSPRLLPSKRRHLCVPLASSAKDLDPWYSDKTS